MTDIIIWTSILPILVKLGNFHDEFNKFSYFNTNLIVFLTYYTTDSFVKDVSVRK